LDVAEDRKKLGTIIGQRVASGEIGSKELHATLNSRPSHPCLILAQRRVGERGFKEALIQLLERHFEWIVFAIILLAILIGA
jgi:hypothetical protein